MKEIKSIIGKVGKNIGNTSKDIIKNTKLSMELSAQEDKLKNVYIDIGKKVYEIYSYGGSIGEYFDVKYKEMIDIEERINNIKEKISENKNNKTVPKNIDCIENNNIQQNIVDSKICKSCGYKNNYNDKFCLKCGRSL